MQTLRVLRFCRSPQMGTNLRRAMGFPGGLDVFLGPHRPHVPISIRRQSPQIAKSHNSFVNDYTHRGRAETKHFYFPVQCFLSLQYTSAQNPQETGILWCLWLVILSLNHMGDRGHQGAIPQCHRLYKVNVGNPIGFPMWLSLQIHNMHKIMDSGINMLNYY